MYMRGYCAMLLSTCSDQDISTYFDVCYWHRIIHNNLSIDLGHFHGIQQKHH